MHKQRERLKETNYLIWKENCKQKGVQGKELAAKNIGKRHNG